MCDETLEALASESKSNPSEIPCDSQSPRQLIESLIELLHHSDASPADTRRLLKELGLSVERCFDSRNADDTYEAALLRAPWLTAEVEELKQQCSALRQSLKSMQLLASRSVGLGQLAQQFNDFAELYVEHETAECNFLDSAYPGPDWAQR